MLYVSFVEILPKATDSLARNYSSSAAGWLANLGFFAGIILIATFGLFQWELLRGTSVDAARCAIRSCPSACSAAVLLIEAQKAMLSRRIHGASP